MLLHMFSCSTPHPDSHPDPHPDPHPNLLHLNLPFFLELVAFQKQFKTTSGGKGQVS